jgi:hypothetical protein
MKRLLPFISALMVLFAAQQAGAWPFDTFFTVTVPQGGASDKFAWLPVVRPACDVNLNGINDADDLILGGREEACRRPTYKSAYHQGGYPPENEGVCTDVIWRAFARAGLDLKALIDADIKKCPDLYPRASKPDPNIDFRRVKNMNVFFSRHAKSLTVKIVPNDPQNLALWQGGDIVVFKSPDHIAVLSDKRNAEGIPLLLHNQGPCASEGDDFMSWYSRGIVAHYRFFQ